MRELFKRKIDGEQREHNQSQQTTQDGRTALWLQANKYHYHLSVLILHFWEIGTYTKSFLKYQFLTLEGFHSKH